MSAVIHGWYRFTDIIWAWQEVLDNDGEVKALKSFIHPDSLTSPQHPFHDPKAEGVEMYMGTLPDGESRLLFSSKQVEYLRYWIKAVGLVDRLLPLPNSDYLLTRDVLSTVSPVYFKNAGEVKSIQKTIERNNKRLRGAIDGHLAATRRIFENVRAAWGARTGTWIAMDFEAWERGHEVITEFGYCSCRFDSKTGELVPIGQEHWVVSENDHYRNGTFVPDNRDHYAFGKSEKVPMKEFRARIKALIEPENPEDPIYWVFHDCNQDLKYLADPHYKLKVVEATPTLVVPDVPATKGTYVVDTSDLFGALEGDASQRRSLEDAYRRLNHKTNYNYHNAGNDAKYVMEILQEMAGGAPLDIQRNQRWPPPAPEPGQPAKTSLKVEEWREEDESDYESLEAILGPPPKKAVSAEASRDSASVV